MNNNEFVEELQKLSINITQDQLNKFEKYKDLLKEYNKKFNLTSILNDEDIYLKHFYDSLCLLKIEEIKNVKSVLDVGTGAGFPGIPLAIILNDVNINLLESNTKKCGFLQIVKETLNLNNITIINERAEIYAKKVREKYDIVTSRAVSNLKILLELEIPLLKVNGLFIPLKANIEEEIDLSKYMLQELSCKIEEILNYNLPKENSKRSILKIKKIKETNKKYPREYNKILKEIKKEQ